METRPRRQQTTEKIGEPVNCGFGKVYLERRNGSPVLSARAYIQGKHKVWSTGERDEKKAAIRATEQFFAVRRAPTSRSRTFRAWGSTIATSLAFRLNTRPAI